MGSNSRVHACRDDGFSVIGYWRSRTQEWAVLS